MILDTTYLLPLAQIAVDKDLLASVARQQTDLKLEHISISLISIFELQAKSAKLNVPPKAVIRAVDAIISAFRVVPFYEPGIIEIAQKVRKVVSDYVDCIIIATAVSEKEDLVTEDQPIHVEKRRLLKEFNLNVFNYTALLKT